MHLQHQHCCLQLPGPTHIQLSLYIKTLSREGGSQHCTSFDVSLSWADCTGVIAEGIWAIAFRSLHSCNPGCTPHACRAAQPLFQELILSTFA